MMQTMPYDINTPEGLAAAKEWMVEFLKLIKQGGVWIVPRSGTIYFIDHAEKTAVRQMSFFNGDSAVETVFVALGWKIKVTG